MEAGRELDALVAEKVMGLEVEWNEDTRCPYCDCTMRYCGSRSRCTQCGEWRHGPYKDYSEDIAAAWEIVEKMEADGYAFSVWRDGFGRGWDVRFMAENPQAPHGMKVEIEVTHAICLAALKAKGIEID